MAGFIPYQTDQLDPIEQYLRLLVMDLLLGVELPVYRTEPGASPQPILARIREMVQQASHGFLQLSSEQRGEALWIYVEEARDEPAEIISLEERRKP